LSYSWVLDSLDEVFDGWLQYIDNVDTGLHALAVISESVGGRPRGRHAHALPGLGAIPGEQIAGP
jgi:hypothetical protein